MDVLAKMYEVADELGEGWSVSPGNWEGSAFLSGPEHAALFVNLGCHGAEKGRLIFSIHYGDAHQHVPSVYLFSEGIIDFNPHKVITVSVGKTSTQIARDIERRLLPDAIPSIAWAAERKASWDVAEDAKRVQLDRIAAIWGTEWRGSDSDLVCGPHLSQMRVRHNAVTIEAHQVPYETAEKIATVLAESAAGSE